MSARPFSELFTDLPDGRGGLDATPALRGERPGDDAGVEIGGKARSLFRLASVGLEIPPGFVVQDRLFRGLCTALPGIPALPTALDDSTLAALATSARALEQAPLPKGFLDLLQARLARLGGRFSVRSSFAIEDEPGRIAAGIFESCVDVPADEAPTALRKVLASALSPAAAAYAIAHGLELAAPPVAVLIHRYVPGKAAGHAAVVPPAGPGRAGETSTASMLLDAAQPPSPRVRTSIEMALATLASRFGAVEVEWVARTDESVVFLQMRPYAQPPVSAGLTEEARVPEPGQTAGPQNDDQAWTWDADHNPLPLSPAHAGLVAWLDQRCRIGIRQQVRGGYLFWRPDPSSQPTSDDTTDANPPGSLPQMFAKLAAELDEPRPAGPGGRSLETVLDRFASFYQDLFGHLQPAAKRARHALGAFLAQHAPFARTAEPTLLTDVESAAQYRRRLATAMSQATDPRHRDQARRAFLHQFGDEAPVWDIAVPTHREAPPLLLPAAHPPADPSIHAPSAPGQQAETSVHPPADQDPRMKAPGSWQRAEAQIRAQLSPELAASFSRCLAQAREAVGIGEDDDGLYARAQARVRAAILAVGQAQSDAGALDRPDDVFFLPFETIRAVASGARPPAPAAADSNAAPGAGSPPATAAASLRAEVEKGRARWQAALDNPPPLPRGRDSRWTTSAHGARGFGTGGRAIGPVFLWPGDRRPTRDAVVVATTLLPTELPLIDVAGVVTETGGPLGHVATQARERGLPAVVGAAEATRRFQPGELVLIDADRGLVLRCGRGP